jgi:hypothetical protein
MDVRELVKATLIQVMQGVKEAQAEADQEKLGQIGKGTRAPRDISFDIAIVATEESGASGGLQVAGIGGKVASTAREESTSRVRFEVPVILP